ncbi:hypothetical protein J8F10_31730 [Gemmata sp. G18]|uniref:Uncharacterized protein n=1 Tax=Gemmata palustris TaxID=2822762 RepID=A0ABS5C1J2_9BACT|nr:hypothetical protein [Gemmata palustris]MBP3959842.1 hypothetical protein [Gemmata palustris]
MTGLRREAYLNSNLGPNASETQKKLKSVIENVSVDLGDKNINEIPLFELLSELSKRYSVSFVVMEEYFKAEQQPTIKEEKPKIAATQLRGLKLGNFLDIVLLSMNATFIVRPDYIEVTTFQRRLEEKVTQVFPVADLAIPIPQSVNQRTLFQNQQFQNQSLAIFGQASLFGAGCRTSGPVREPVRRGRGRGRWEPAQRDGGGGPFGAGQQLGNQGNLGSGAGSPGSPGPARAVQGTSGASSGSRAGTRASSSCADLRDRGQGRVGQHPHSRPMPGMGDDDVPTVRAELLNSLGYYPRPGP